MLYLTQYIKILSSEHIINIFEIIQTLSPQYLIFKIWCVFHTLSRMDSTSQISSTQQYMSFMAIVLDSGVLGEKYLCKQIHVHKHTFLEEYKHAKICVKLMRTLFMTYFHILWTFIPNILSLFL